MSLEVNPARLPHGAVRLQDHRGPARRPCRRGDGRQDAGGAGPAGCVLQPYVAVKEAVFPFNKLQGVDLILGPGDALHR